MKNPLFPSNLLSKLNSCQPVPPLFENLVGGSAPQQKGGSAHYDKAIRFSDVAIASITGGY